MLANARGTYMRRILTFTSLFPNSEQPRHGIFIETRLRKLVESGEVEARVVAPVPWFPAKSSRFGRLGACARVPFAESRDGVGVVHPRFVALPGPLARLTPMSMALGALPGVRRVIDAGFDFDLIDAHFYYPDGVAAALLGKWLRKPLVITARGSDITYWPSQPLPRRMMRWAAGRASRNAAVSSALADEMRRLGFPDGKSVVLRNGVDPNLFYEEPRDDARARLHLRGKVALSVGNLIELKGHHLAIEAIADMPDMTLIVIGTGPEEEALRALAARLGIADRVRFHGVMPQAALRSYYSAADLLILASSREGWPNVLLEAMACGTPVVATRVWGIPEIVAAPEAGVLIDEREVSALREGVRRLLAAGIDRRRTRAYAERFGWAATTAAQLAMFAEVIDEHGVSMRKTMPISERGPRSTSARAAAGE